MKLSVVQLLKNFPTSYETRRFITVFTRALPLVLILSQINPLHKTSSYLLRKIHFNIIYILIFLVVSFLLLFPPISYMHSLLHSYHMPITMTKSSTIIAIGRETSVNKPIYNKGSVLRIRTAAVCRIKRIVSPFCYIDIVYTCIYCCC